jgi:hypothetical protein
MATRHGQSSPGRFTRGLRSTDRTSQRKGAKLRSTTSGLDRTSRLVHHCGSVPAHRTHRSLLPKKQSSESSGGNLRLSEHVRLLSPEPVVVTQPQSTRVEEPTLLCNQVGSSPRGPPSGVFGTCLMQGEEGYPVNRSWSARFPTRVPEPQEEQSRCPWLI